MSELLDYINNINVATKQNGGTTTLATNISYWENMNVYSPDDLERYLLMCVLQNLASDINKGFARRIVSNMKDATLEDIQAEIDAITSA